ncbi:MAG: T9SS type A sorting domain-containing protein [Saprospiraceae bacterium]
MERVLESVAITGGAGTISYQWQSSNSATGPFADIVGATNATYTTDALTTTTYYQVIISASASDCESATSEVAQVEVIEDIVITANPTDDSICEGGTSTLSVAITGGAGTISYQWQSSSSATGPFADIAGATNATYTTDALTSTTYYQVIISASASDCESATSEVAQVEVIEDIVITAQPTDDSICEGGTSTLSVAITGGAGTISYQWQSSSSVTGPFADIAGATDATYTTDALSATTYYQVVISASASGCDAATSAVAEIEVIDDIEITAQPTDDSICEGGTSTLSIAITGGAGTVAYQWQSSSSATGPFADITGATNATYTTDALSATTYYQVIISASASDCESATSEVAEVEVIEDIVITANPTDDSICEGGTSTLSVAITGGAGTISYQWQSSSSATGPFADIAGATNATYTTDALSATTYYQVVISASASGCDAATSEVAEVEVIEDIVVTADPTDDTICEGGTSTLSVAITGGTGTISYQWQSSSSATGPFADIAGATNATYTTGALSVTTYYQVLISASASGCDAATSAVAEIEVIDDIEITAQPTDDSICEGGTSTLSIAITGGAGTVAYQWQSSSSATGPFADITGATNATYTTDALSATTYYQVVISASASDCESATSEVAQVEVIEDIVITANPTDDSICEGGTSTLSVAITGGAGTISYQWQSSSSATGPFADIVGATNATYTTDALSATTYYQVVISASASGCEAATSEVAEVEVIEDIVVTADPTDDTICEGGTSTLSVAITGGAGTISYQWQSSSSATGPFADITGATNATYTTGALSVTTYYQVLISASASGCDAATSAVAEIEVIDDIEITAQPTDDSICEGGTSTLSIAITGGAGTVAYQWQSSSSATGPFADITGATNATYTTDALSATTYYQVVISASASDCESATSEVAQVEVIEDIVITANPTDDSICEGGTSTLSVAITGGAGTISYQWQSSSSATGPFADIAGATNATYTTDALSATTYYQVVISASASGCEAATSAVAEIEVIADIEITAQPTDDSICEGGTSTLSIAITGGAGTISYQWQSSSSATGPFVNIAGATNATYITNPLTTTTYYQVLVNASASGCDAATSAVAEIEVIDDIEISAQPLDAEICQGGTATMFITVAGGSGDITYQWQSSNTETGPWSNISGATSDTYTTPVLNNTTYYQVVIGATGSGCDEVISGIATVNVVVDPTIVVQPLSQTICEESNATLEVEVVGGTPSLTYQWQTANAAAGPWTDIDGAIEATYITEILSAGQYYRVIVSASGAGCGTATSNPALVSVNPLVIVTAGDDGEVCSNGQYLLSGEIIGGIGIGTWTTTGDGTFADDRDLNTTYTPGPADILAGTVTLILTSDDPDGNGPCTSDADFLILTINDGPVITNINVTPSSCVGNNGAISLTVTGGATPYDINWSNGATGLIANNLAAGSYTVTISDANNCTIETTIDVVKECFDLALTKELISAGPFFPGDQVSFLIAVTNQGNIDATNVEIIDYIPTGLNLTDAAWSAAGTRVIPLVAANTTETITVTFQISSNYAGGNVVNYAEISNATNALGLTDEDSNFDQDNTNDAGGAPNSPADNYINGDGTGAIGSGDAAGDEDDHDSELINVQSLIDLELNKQVNNSRPFVGQRVTFTITVVNNGPSTATDPKIVDYLPAGFTDVQFVSVDGTANVQSGNIIIWDPIDIPANTTATLVYSVLVVEAGDGEYINEAEVASVDQEDIDSTPNNGVDTDGDGDCSDDPDDEDDGDCAEVDPIKLVDLELDKQVNNATPDVGSNIVYTITLTNQGPSTASGVVVTDKLPSGLSFVSSDAGASYNSTTGAWNVGTIGVGQTRVLNITARVQPNGDYINLAEVTAANEDDVDSTPGNGVDTNGNGNVSDDPGDEDDGDGVEIVPVPIIDLELNKSVDDLNGNVQAGEEITFTVELTNRGPSTATGVVVNDLLESGFRYLGHTATGAYNPTTGEWIVGTLQAGQTVVLNIRVEVNVAGAYFNLAEVTQANEEDLDSTPGNGVDTDNDGDFVDDPGDEDDGDGVIVDVDCDMLGNVANIFCDDNGTPLDPDDDQFFVEVVAEGFGTGTSTGWIATVDGTFVGQGDYSGTVVTLGPFPISEGDVLIYIIDNTDSGCRVILGGEAPAPCSLRPCDLQAEITSVECDDNQTGNNASDDVFYVSFSVAGSNNNSWSAKVGGEVLLSSLNYNRNVTLGPFPIAGGFVDIEVYDDELGACAEILRANPPENTCSQDCAVSIILADGPVCNDNGTPGNPADDTFTFTLLVDALNASGTTWTDNLGNQGTFGQVKAFGPFPIAGGPITITIADAGATTCRNDITVTPPTTCSDFCDLNAQLTQSPICDDNNTPSNPNDDTYSFIMLVTGDNVGTSGWEALIGGELVSTGAYNLATQVGPLPIVNGTVQVIIRDIDDPSCTTSLLVVPPSNCSDVCQVVVTQPEAGLCDPNGTPDNPADDLFTFNLAINGNSGSDTWLAYIDGAFVQSGGYGGVFSFGPYLIADGPIDVTIVDSEDNTCIATIRVIPPQTCSNECGINAVVENTICLDNGTPYDPSDDRYYAVVKVTGFNGSSGWSTPQLYANGISHAYGSVILFGPYNISGGNRTLNFFDLGDESCKASLFITAPEPCSADCLIDAVVGEIVCNDNGTSDPADDTFTVPVTINGQHNFGSCWREIGGTARTGGYGQTIVFGPYLITNGDVSIKIADCQDITCQVQIVAPAPASCSQPDCEITSAVKAVNCDDSNTPADPSDDIFFVTLDLSVQNAEGGLAWRASLLDGTAIGTGVFPTSHTFGPFDIANGEIGIIIEDVIDPTCTDTIFVQPPTTCSDGCLFEIIADGEGVCNDNGTPNVVEDDTYSFTINVNGTNIGNSGWQASIGGQVVALGTYGSNVTIEGMAIGTDVTVVVSDIDDPSCGSGTVTVTSPAACSDACGIQDVTVLDIACSSETTYSFKIIVTGEGQGWQTPDGAVRGLYNTEVSFPDQPANGQLQSFTIVDVLVPNCDITFEVQAPAANQCSLCDVQVLMPAIYCDDNGTPLDPNDDVFYFEMIFESTALAGSGWTAQDPNGTTGVFGENIVTFGPYSIKEEGAVSFVVLSDVNPNCQVAVYVPAPQSCSAGCQLSADLINVICNDAGTVNNREDDVFITSLRFNANTDVSIGWRIQLLDGTDLGTGLYETERFFGPFSVNDGPVTFIISDLVATECRDTITVNPALTCSTASCDIRAVVENTTCSDNGTPDDPNDDFFTIEARVDATNGSPNGWIAADGTSGNYGELVTFGPFSLEESTYDITITDKDAADCELILTIERPIPTVVCPADVAVVVGSNGSAQDLVCTDVDQILNNPESLTLTGEPIIDNACGVESVDFNDELIGGDCDDIVILRTFVIDLISGETIVCEQRITIRKADVEDVVYPTAASFVCTDNYQLDDNGHPHPDVIGYPQISTAFGQYPLNPDYCNLSASYQDTVDPSCGGAATITRTWTITDNCSGESRTGSQIISITGDGSIPTINCPAGYDQGVLFSTDPALCTATIDIPEPTFDQVGCAQGWQLRTEIRDSEGNVVATIANGENRTITGVEIGDYLIEYTVFDDCGAATSTTCFFSVADLEQPVAVCEAGINISLGGFGVARLFVANIDAGSYDNCKIESIEVRRIYTRNPETCDSLTAPVYSDWNQFVEVTCCDAGQYVTVELKVTDESGNVDVCSVQVLVEDKTLPYCYGLEDGVVSCDELPDGFDPYNTDQMSALFGLPLVEDNCAAQAIELEPEVSMNDCGFGYIIRRFVAVDLVGNVSAAVFEQQIVFDYSLNYEIGFPRDTETNCIFDVDTLIVQKTGCDSITVAYQDVFLPVEGAECYNILRTYHVINHCEWDGVSAPNVISRDEDCDNSEGEERVWVLVRPNGAFIDKDSDEQNRVPQPGIKDPSCDGTTNPEGYWRTTTSTGYWAYTQRIKMYDNIAATVVFQQQEAFCTETADCEGSVEYPFAINENCLPENLDIHVFIDLDADEVLDGEITDAALTGTYPNFVITGTYPIGKHQFRLDIIDGCGNYSTEKIRFEVIDCYVPEPHCLNGLIVDLVQLPQSVDADGDGDLDDAGALVFAAELANCNESDCTPGLRFSVNRVGAVPDINQSSILLTCDDGARVLLEVYVWDNALNPRSIQPNGVVGGPNYRYCTAEVLVQDLEGLCSDCVDDMLIAGDIYTEGGQMIQGVAVQLEGGMSAQSMTERTGHFEFAGMLEGQQYTIKPQKDGDDRNGITTLDILLIQRHLLGIKPFDSPYLRLAADVNGSHTITTLDLLLMRALLLGNITEIPGNTSWRFVDATYEFPNPQNPWAEAFPESITTDLVANCMFNVNFIGVKIGDVNGTARLTELVELDERNTNGKFGFNLQETFLQEGQTYTIDFNTSELRQILGYQFALAFDPSSIEIVGANYEIAAAEHFGWNFVQEGILTTSWNHTIADPSHFLQAGSLKMFSLEIKAKRSGKLSELLAVSSRILDAEAYDLDKQLLDVELRFEQGQPLAIEQVAHLELLQNRPNPFHAKTTIEFILPAASEVTFTIHNINGKVIKMTKSYYEKGRHLIELDRQDLPAGLMYYTVSTDKETSTKKMILL